ncbi:hypothetical protein QJS04_geneDACA021630 [Acorus gramineus]|uniref:CCR4-NOT transcription complex subunit 1 n=1 Tax=Acorus gramineus TaxID=55184 RepID=A0AAV9AAS3_ACOGR|nr:hypothetical protein QJS04_geneDACA021630 [Acorus gramineus]
MVPFASTASGQIRFLLNSSNDSDHASAFRELCQFVDYGLEGCILLLQNCLDHLNAHGGDLQIVKKPELVSAVFRYLLGRPNFSTAFCESLRSTSMSEGFLGSLSKALNLSTPEKIGIGLALYDSENPDFRMRGQNFCIAQIEELCLNPTVISDELIQDIVMFLFRSEGLAKHVDSFTKMLSLLQLKEKTPFILAPMVADHHCSDKSLRHLDMFSEFLEDDFDSVLAEIEKEMSMADIMRELGYGCTVNSAHCKDVLSLFLPLNEVTLAKILSTIAQTHYGLEDSQSAHTTFCSALGSSADSSLLSSWNVEILVDSIKQLVPEVNWIRVMENLDHEGFYIPDEGAFTLFMSIYANACQDPFPLHAVCSSVWKNAEDAHATNPDIISRISDLCQEFKILASVLDTAPFHFSIKLAAFAFRMEHVNLEKWIYENLSAYKDAFFEDCLKFLKAIPLDGAADLSTNPNQHSSALINVYQDASSIFFKVLQAQTGQLMSDQLPEELKKLQVESVHFNPMMQGAGGSDSSPPTDGSSDNIEIVANAYFHQMFSGQLSIEGMVQMLARFKESSEKREKAIFECMINNLFEEYKFFPKYPEMQLKIVSVLFGSLIKHQLVTHLTLGVALRAVLDALRKSVDSKMFMFGAKALEQFVDRLVEWPQYCNHILQISHMRSTHVELVSFIERALARISSSQSESNGGNNASIDHQGSANATTEEESEILWQLMNSGTMQSGQQFSSSTMVQPRHHGFLEDRAKSTVASVNYMKPSSPAGQPSLVSLGADIISNQKAIASQSLQSVSSSLASSVPLSVSSSSGFLRSTRGITPAGRQHSYSTGFGAALNIETLVAAAERRDTPIEAPASEIQDKILFMINNLSATNMDAKAKEFIEILKEEYYPWFAQYIVMKRASIEPNFHDLYLKFLEKVNSKSLNKEIVKATYENCKVLLRSELIKSSSEERSLLKNLGSWLGKFTIGRNQALRAREIDPKALIIEAYEKGLMIAVIPFTSKILEPCQSSLAYQPPNPWTMGILGLLVEIYALPNLKMNLKFDIEVLFKNLGVDMKDVKPTSLLKDRIREVEGNPDFSNKDIAASQPAVVADNTGMISTLNQVEIQPEVVSASRPSSHSNLLTQYTAPHHLASSTLMEDDKLGSIGLPERIPPGPAMSQVSPSQSPLSASQLLSPISNMGIHVVINQKLNALGLPFQRIVPIAMDRAIKDIVTPVVQRSVSIASQTTKELVPKDYALEADENRIFNASHLMVASLAGSLAHVSCKELLRTALSNNLRSLLQTLNVGSDLLEQTVQLITNDNLDLGCAIIEQATTDKALLAIDGEIASQLSIRKNKRNASAFYDANPYAQGFARVPEALRPKPGRLSAAQQRVYDDFVRFPWQNQPSQSSSALNAQPLSSGSLTGSSGPRGYNSSPNRLNSTLFSSAQVTPGFGTQSLDLISEDMEPGPTQLLSTSAHIGISDGVIQNAAEISTVASPFPPTVVTSDLNLVEMSSVVKLSPTTPTERLGISIPEQLLTTGDALEKYQIVAQKLETVIAKDIQDAEIPGIIAEVPEIILRSISRDEAALAVAQKAFKSLYENASNNIHVSSHLAILTSIRDVCKLVVKELTSWVIYSDEERKFNKDITVGLIRSELLNLAEYNVHLAKLIDGGRNKAATEFAISLVQTLVSQEPGVSMSEFYNVIDALTKLAMRPGSPESLQQLVDIARNPSANSIPLSGFVNKEEKSKQLRDKKVASVRSMTNREEYGAVDSAVTDPAGFRDQVSVLFSEWCRICELPVTNDASHTHFISQLHQSGLLKGDDVTDRFFRILTELSVGHCLSLEGQSSQQTQYLFVAIDMYAKLVYLVVKVLSVTGRVIQKDADEKKTSFNPRPYFRLFINWLLDLTSDPVLEVANFQVHFLYKGTLRVLLVLLHDFPEFLCDYHFSFCDVIPPSCIQMRNVILSAFPRNMRLPDPSTPNLKIDLLPEITVPPRILSEVDGALKTKQMKADIDEYFKAISLLQNKSSLPTPQNLDILSGGAAMDIFQDIIQEQITRVLLERLIVNRPHPWGLLITFIELIKNPRYNFWNRSFTHCAPEIERLFDTVARSCGGPKAVDDGMVSGNISDNNH